MFKSLFGALALSALMGALALAPPAFAQDGDAERRAELASQVVDAVDLDLALEAALEALGPTILPNTDSAPEAEHQRRIAVFSDVLRDVGPAFLARYMEEIGQLYAATFTVEELEAMLAFYDTPVGRSILSKTYVLGAQMEVVLQRMLPDFVRDAVIELCEREGCDPVQTLEAGALI